VVVITQKEKMRETKEMKGKEEGSEKKREGYIY
jgi:hypothetical protein